MSKFDKITDELFLFYKREIRKRLGHLDISNLNEFADIESFARGLDTKDLLDLAEIFKDGFRQKIESGVPPQK